MLLARFLNICLALVLSALTARLLGPVGRGIYALPTIDAGLVVSTFGGLTIGTTYFLLNQGASRGVLHAAWKSALIFSGLGTIAIAIMALIGHEEWVILPAALSLVPSAFIAVATGYWIGRHRVRRNNAVTLAVTSATLLFILPALLLLGADPRWAIGGWLAGNTVVAIAATVWVAVHARDLPHEAVDLGRFLRYCANIGVTGFVTLLNYNADVYIIALFTTPAQLGLYTIAVAGAESLLIFTQVASSVAMPDIGSLDIPQSARLVARVARTNFAVAAILCIIAAMAAPWAVALVYGPMFLDAVPALRILLLGVLFMAPAGLISSFFTVKLGSPRIPLIVAGISAAITAAVTLALVPRMGIVGGAIGTAAGYGLSQALVSGMFLRRSGLPVTEILFVQSDDVRAYRRVFGEIARRCAF